MDHRAVHVAPLTDALLGDDNYVCGNEHAFQGSAQTDRLTRPILDLRLDHEKVEIAVLARISAGVGAEQDHARLGRRGRQQTPASLLYDRLVEHAITVANETVASPIQPPGEGTGGASTAAAPFGEAGVSGGGTGLEDV